MPCAFAPYSQQRCVLSKAPSSTVSLKGSIRCRGSDVGCLAEGEVGGSGCVRRHRMEQQGLTPRDLEHFIGPSGRVSEVLNRKRPLSLRMVKAASRGLEDSL